MYQEFALVPSLGADANIVLGMEPMRSGFLDRPAARRRAEHALAELGAGFRIASHDLEIRGAGNLLGKDQSGQIEAIGFELYSQLLDEAVREIKGEAPREDFEPDVALPVPAFIPDPYMPDVHQRLYFYKRYATASTDEELEEIRAEIVDRCGDPPDEVDFLGEVMKVWRAPPARTSGNVSRWREMRSPYAASSVPTFFRSSSVPRNSTCCLRRSAAKD